MSTFEMNDQQVAGLAAAICATAEAMGQEMNPGTAAMMAEDLCAYSVSAVKAALKACRFEVKGKLAMADILQRVQAADGRPGKDEAWAIAMTTNDDFETVVLTGISTNVAIPGFTISAVEFGYHVVIPEDCIAGGDPVAHKVIVEHQLRMLATITDHQSVIAAINGVDSKAG